MPSKNSHTYSKLLERFTESHLSISIFENHHGDRVYYDVVIYKRVRVHKNKQEWRRGTNLKPSDLPKVIGLIESARAYIDEHLDRKPPIPLPDLMSKHKEGDSQEEEDQVALN